MASSKPTGPWEVARAILAIEAEARATERQRVEALRERLRSALDGAGMSEIDADLVLAAWDRATGEVER